MAIRQRGPILGFDSSSRETEYRDWKLRRIRGRTDAFLLLSAIGFAASGLMDFWYLPEWLASLSAGVHFFLICPALLLTLLALRGSQPDRFQCYLTVGWTAVLVPLVALLVYAQAMQYPLPYEGLLIIVMFIYLLSGLTTQRAFLLSATICLFYALGISGSIPPPEVASVQAAFHPAVQQAFYLATANCIGLAGAVILEDQGRRMYLARLVLAVDAYTDALTDLPNRRSVNAAFDRLWRQACRDGESISLFYVDIDHFKRLNDALGHDAGDAALCQVASVLKELSRKPMDIVGRIGGEEFVAVAYGLSPEGARGFARILQKSVSLARIPHPDSPVSDRVTVSVGGIQTCPASSLPDESIWQAADQAMYAAKRNGRNRAVFRESDSRSGQKQVA